MAYHWGWVVRILIDTPGGSATFISGTEYADRRRYYDCAGALIVCRNRLEFGDLHGHVVDAAIGWDVAQPGFVVREADIGKKRTKITVYRALRGKRYDKKLTEVLKDA